MTIKKEDCEKVILTTSEMSLLKSTGDATAYRVGNEYYDFEFTDEENPFGAKFVISERAWMIKKPRTKAEYERVDLVEHWEYFKLMSDEGDLYVNCTDLSYEGMLGDNINLANALHDGSCIYRKVEIEIDERQEFIDTYNELRREFKLQHKVENFHNFLFDSGKFKLVE